ncbi:MAG: hypothetical protein JETCAE01_25530 [Anaerolineaceae bacterium]|nr:MAG: hypothetical protein JETCAE01_25530 [Anaerolineaceae bacterium]
MTATKDRVCVFLATLSLEEVEAFFRANSAALVAFQPVLEGADWHDIALKVHEWARGILPNTPEKN